MPLTWKQIKKGVKISDFTIENVPALIKKGANGWEDFFDSQQTLNLKS
jgi:DNA primase